MKHKKNTDKNTPQKQINDFFGKRTKHSRTLVGFTKVWVLHHMSLFVGPIWAILVMRDFGLLAKIWCVCSLRRGDAGGKGVWGAAESGSSSAWDRLSVVRSSGGRCSGQAQHFALPPSEPCARSTTLPWTPLPEKLKGKHEMIGHTTRHLILTEVEQVKVDLAKVELV